MRTTSGKKLGAFALGIALLLSLLPALASPALAYNDDPNQIDWTKVEGGNCLVTKDGYGFTACTKGDVQGIWRVALIGDSHMRQYFAPLDILAQRYQWRVKYISKSACTVGDYRMLPQNSRWASCRDWNHRLERYLATEPRFDLVINSNSAFVSHANPEIAAAYRKVVLSQVERGTHWMVIGDNPKPGSDFQACIAKDPATAAERCRRPYSKSMRPVDILPRNVVGLPGVTVLDLRKQYCPDECPAVIGGVVVYRDYSHISSTFAQTLLPYLDRAVPGQYRNIQRIARGTTAVTFPRIAQLYNLLQLND